MQKKKKIKYYIRHDQNRLKKQAGNVRICTLVEGLESEGVWSCSGGWCAY